MPSQENNLILQSYITFSLITELKNNKLLESDFFASMNFGASWMKESLKEIGVDNQGCALLALYAMLVIPRQLIGDKYPQEYLLINQFLGMHTQNTQTDYDYKGQDIDFLRHIRNAVAHARVSFQPEQFVTFSDESRNKTFSTDLPLCHLGAFLDQLQKIHLKYITELQNA